MLKQIASIIALIVLFPATASATAADLDQSASNFQTRLCERVNNRFAENNRLWKRVNTRIERRFGFVCTRENEQSIQAARVVEIIATTYRNIEVVLDRSIPPDTSLYRDQFVVFETTDSGQKIAHSLHHVEVVLGKHRPFRSYVLDIKLDELMQSENEGHLHIIQSPGGTNYIIPSRHSFDTYELVLPPTRQDS